MSLGGFGGKNFEVSSNKIYTFDEFANEISLSVEDQEVEGNKPSTYIKGMDLEKPSISLDIRQSSSVDVETEIKDWRSICYAATPYMLFIGNDPVSDNKYLLTKVSISDAVFLPNGKKIRCKLKLSFEEYVRQGVKKEEGTTSESKKSASSSSSKKSSSSKSKKKSSSSTSSEMSSDDEAKVTALENEIFGG